MVVGHWSIRRILVVFSDPGRVSRTSYDRIGREVRKTLDEGKQDVRSSCNQVAQHPFMQSLRGETDAPRRERI